MWTTFLFAAALLITPTMSLGQEAEVSTDVKVEKNLGQAIKADCAGLTSLKLMVCIRETKKARAKSKSRGQNIRGRERAAKNFEAFEGARGKRLKEIGSGERKQSVRKAQKKIGGKVQQMTADERRKLKGKMNTEKITDNKREQNRRAKVESLKKRIHQR